MKKLLFTCLIIFTMISSLSAYELNGDFMVKWTGYKTEAKAPVSGGFNNVKLNIMASDDFSSFLKSAKVTIVSSSLESKNVVRNQNIVTTLFSLASSSVIKGEITAVDEMKKLLMLKLTLNEVTKIIPMNYEVIDSKIMAKGMIDVLNFDMKSSFLAFAKKCAALHQNKSYSDVAIAFTLPFK